MPVETPGPSTSSSAPAQRSANASYSRTSCGTDEREDDPVERLEVDERPQQHGQLVAGVRAVGADAELLGQRGAVEQPEDGLGVADVDREEHRAATLVTEVFDLRLVGLSPMRLASASAVSAGSSPSPRSSSIVTSLEV